MDFLLITLPHFTLIMLSTILELLLSLLTLFRKALIARGFSLVWWMVYSACTKDSWKMLLPLWHKYTLNPLHDEVDIIIQAFKILRETGIQTPENVISDLIGDFSFIVYDSSSKLLILASVSAHQLDHVLSRFNFSVYSYYSNCALASVQATSGFFPMFWGIDSESSLILSDDPDIVEKANLSMLQRFPSDHVYISRGGLEVIFDDYTSKVEQQPLETAATYAASEIESWQPARPPFFKVNTHGIAFPREKMVGIGVIVRDSRGQMIVAGSKKIEGFTSQIHAHSLACLEGLTLMLKAGLRNVIWELVGCDTKNSAYARLSIPFVVSLIKQFDAIGFSNVSMSANKAACGLAEYAKEVEDCIVWELEIPECISGVVKLESQGHA
ncbi:hypothetical protein QQ045_025340 [Rhodiola kirilowii]